MNIQPRYLFAGSQLRHGHSHSQLSNLQNEVVLETAIFLAREIDLRALFDTCRHTCQPLIFGAYSSPEFLDPLQPDD